MSLKSHFWSRWVTVGVWCLLVLSVVGWAGQWSRSVKSTDAALSAPAATFQAPVADPQQLARLLGASEAALNTATAQATEATPAVSQRVRVTGVASSESGEGLALLAVDGNPPRPYARGSQVLPDWVLQSVGAKSLALVHVSNGQQISLPVPPRPANR